MNLISVYLEASVQCPRCQSPIFLNRAAESVLCTNCQNTLALPPERWVGLLADEIAEAAQMEPGTGTESSSWGGLNAQLKYGRLDARCAKCKNPYPNLDPAQLSGQIFCPACGTKTAARQAPAWMKQMHPAIVALVGEAPGADQAQPMTGIEPVVIHCYSCGGQLSCDGSTRNPACNFCNAENFLPDPLWLRLHPAETREAWFILLDLGSAIGVLPDDCWHFAGIAYAPTGGCIVGYQDSDDNWFVDGLDGHGLVAWRNKSLELSDETVVVSSPQAQYVVIADAEHNVLQYIDPNTGASLWRIQGPEDIDGEPAPEQPRPVEVEDHKGVAVDSDGTIVIAQNGDDEDYPLLTRYSGDGSFQPMWSAQHRRKHRWGDNDWSDLADGQLVLPYSCKVTIGNDGVLYVLEDEMAHLAAFDRTGRMLFNRALSGGPDIDRVRGFGADAGGNIYALCELSTGKHKDWAHLVRIWSGQQPELVAGKQVPGSAPIGEYDEHISVAPNGNLYIAHELDSIRILDAYGKLLWRSHSTERRDAQDD